MEMTDDIDGQSPPVPDTSEAAPAEQQPMSPSDLALLRNIRRRILGDKKFHEKAFDLMKRDMRVAMHGADKDWPEGNYRANIAGRHVKQKTAALYAKNPKAVARRKESLDFTVWDENPDSLMLAYQTIEAGVMAVQQSAMAPPAPDPMTGAVMPVEPQLPPGFQEAQALMADVQQGFERREQINKLSRTLEIVFAHQLREQKPLDTKMAMKQLVRRASTTGVGYVELGYQRETGPRPGMMERLADTRARLDHLRNLAQQVADGEVEETDAEIAELEASMQALQTEQEIILREGLILDFPQSTRVIPDRLCKSLVGFVGARHVTLEYTYTKNEVEELFGVKLGKQYAARTALDKSWKDGEDYSQNEMFENQEMGASRSDDICLVWKHYDKPSGLVYYVCDGFPSWLRPPAPPDVFVEDFWPVYALTFNAVESEDELFPPSDVTLLLHMQMEHNRSRQGKREHRDAARPRWVFPNGVLNEQDLLEFRSMRAFDAVGLDIDPQTKLADVLQPVPVPGVDPNLYDTNEVFTDTQIVVGSQEAQFGGVSKATATESAIAAGSSQSSDGSSVDDLDAFLTMLARAAGQILLGEMSEETVKKIAGPGAVWPELSLEELASEVWLEVEAGSSGRPNKMIEIQNWKEILPYLLQMGSIPSHWLARETLKRLDDRLDLTEAVVAGIPSIMAQNRMQSAAPAGPGGAPEDQGAKGADNAPAAPKEESPGQGPAFGSNQV